jgi:hypothetical protein
MEDLPATPKLRGWLDLFTATFVGFLLLNGSALMDAAFQRTNPIYPSDYAPDRIAVLHAVAGVGLFVRLAFVAVGLSILWLVQRRDSRLERWFKIYAASFLIFEVIVRAVYFFMGGFMIEGSWLLYWGASALRGGLLAIGFVSLRRWTLAPEPAVVAVARGAADSQLPQSFSAVWFWLGSIMVGLPFILNLFVEPTQLISGLLVGSTEASGLALMIEAVSVAIGLLLLMKLAFRLRVGWILVLFPICCVALSVAYIFLSVLHLSF